MKTLLPILMTVLMCSCSATLPPKKAPQKAPISAEQELKAAKGLADNGESKKALSKLKKLVALHPESDLADDAHFMMGQIYASQQQFNEAIQSYRAISIGGLQSPLEVEANIRSVKILMKTSRPKEAAALLETSESWQNPSTQQKFEIEKLRYETHLASGNYLEALKALVVLVEQYPQAGDVEKYRGFAGEILESKLTSEELGQVADSRSYGFVQTPAKFRYSIILMEQRQYSDARDYLNDVADSTPQSELTDRAKELIQQMDARNRVDPKTIGVVLPLSGKQAAVGYKTLRGIQLGLGIYGKTPSGFRLAVVDSEGNPDTARRAVEKLVTEDNVIAIIGGLLSRTVGAEAAKAQELGIPAIMLSQKAGITQAGDYIFRNALTSQMQVQYLVDLAMNNFGYRNFAILFPNDAYGVEYTNLFWAEVRSRGGNITGAQPYDPKETDFRGHVQRLVGLFYQEDRAEEYKLRYKAWTEKNPRRSARQAAPSVEEILPPLIDFDAVFIPDNARAVGQIAPMLAYNNVTRVKLLGTNLWNSAGIINRGQQYVEEAVFVDSFLSSDRRFQQSEFYTNFKATFEEEPGLTEIQAYDSALILRQLVASGERSRPGLQERLVNLRSFSGAIGRLSVNPTREILRPMTALTIRDRQITELNSTVR